MKPVIRCLILIFAFPVVTFSQVNVKDSAISAPLIKVSYAFQVPGGNLAQRFGNNSNLGVEGLYKTRRNWLIGIDGSFMFGSNIKEDSILRNISTPDGSVINQNGEFAEIFLYERGYSSSFKMGKLFPFLSPNPNSGLFILGGIGFLQHKIRIENKGNNAPPVLGDYKKGYDRLTNGLAISETIGYMYLGDRRLINFFGGIEFVQAWTQNRRSFDFDTMQKDTTRRKDYLYGIRIGWIIPLYKKMPNAYYYY